MKPSWFGLSDILKNTNKKQADLELKGSAEQLAPTSVILNSIQPSYTFRAPQCARFCYLASGCTTIASSNALARGEGKCVFPSNNIEAQM